MRKIKLLAVFLSLILVIPLATVSCIRGGEEGNIALIRLNGYITNTPCPLIPASAITPKKVRDWLSKAGKDEEIKAVILSINSPGGEAASSQEIATMVKEFHKPVVVSMADLAASGGYYISAHADWIIAQPGTATGSIGVIIELMNVSGLMEKLGMKPEIIKAGKHKDMFSGLRSLTEEERKMMQELVDTLHEDFIKAVAKERDMRISKVRELATGEIYTGEKAKELGLVDELGGLKEAMEKAAELANIEEPQFVEYKPPKPWWAQFIPGFFGGSQNDALKLSQQRLQYLQLLRILRGWNGVPCYQVP